MEATDLGVTGEQVIGATNQLLLSTSVPKGVLNDLSAWLPWIYERLAETIASGGIGPERRLGWINLGGLDKPDWRYEVDQVFGRTCGASRTTGNHLRRIGMSFEGIPGDINSNDEALAERALLIAYFLLEQSRVIASSYDTQDRSESVSIASNDSMADRLKDVRHEYERYSELGLLPQQYLGRVLSRRGR